MRARIKGLDWEVTLTQDLPGGRSSWINLRPIGGGGAQGAYYKDTAYFMDNHEVVFEDSQSTGQRRYLTKMARDTAQQELDRRIAETLRWVELLEGKLRSDEKQQILEAIERAKTDSEDGGDDDLRGRLTDLENAGSLILVGMARG